MYRDFDRRLKKEIKKHVDARISSRSLMLSYPLLGSLNSRSLMLSYALLCSLLHKL